MKYFALRHYAAFVLTVSSAAPLLATTHSVAQPRETTVTGVLTCSHCRALLPDHKGYSRWTWALRSLQNGDTVSLFSENGTYALKLNSEQVFSFAEEKVTVIGELVGQTLLVKTIKVAAK